jgi:outer membrane protein OmpA-like peptidoglycan-associated protein
VGILTAPAARFLALPLTLLATVGPAFAQQAPIELGAFGTMASFAPSYDLRMGLGGGGRLAYHWRPEWAVEVELGAGRASIAGGGRTVAVVLPELHVVRTLDPARHAWFVLGGYARPGFRGTPPGRFTDAAITLGFGHRAALGGRLALRTELRGAYTFASGRTGRGAGHLLALVGLSFTPGNLRAADADSDGIDDRRDRCPRTPAGAVVDASGCPSDSDGDGHLNGLDRCPNTPIGVLTDTSGCPVDSDHDGVYDGLDQCPGSTGGVAVDLRGCPLDSDGDGVNDAADRCPRSPPSAVVDASGCPMTRDTDGDGVEDARDRCPGTPARTTVDPVGCQVLFAGGREPLVLQGVTFQRGSARLEGTSFVALDQVAASLLAHTEVRIEIAGYTDSTGSAAVNTRLSAARAGAVQVYLRQHGVPAERMHAAGYGPANPVASNATAEGRARNRRVELHQSP